MTAPARTCLLVTGFGAFPGVADNPTESLMRWLDQHRPGRPRGLELVTAVLPVEWSAAPAVLDDLVTQVAPDAMLHFGASRRAGGFRIEQWARNRTSFQSDAVGRRAPAPHVKPGGPRVLRAPFNAAGIALHLQGLGLPSAASADAGRYLCNAIYYLALERCRRERRPRTCLFVHVPAQIAADHARKQPLSLSELHKGALALIDVVAAAAQRSANQSAARLAPAQLQNEGSGP